MRNGTGSSKRMKPLLRRITDLGVHPRLDNHGAFPRLFGPGDSDYIDRKKPQKCGFCSQGGPDYGDFRRVPDLSTPRLL